jgi:hypothetical protein
MSKRPLVFDEEASASASVADKSPRVDETDGGTTDTEPEAAAQPVRGWRRYNHPVYQGKCRLLMRMQQTILDVPKTGKSLLARDFLRLTTNLRAKLNISPFGKLATWADDNDHHSVHPGIKAGRVEGLRLAVAAIQAEQTEICKRKAQRGFPFGLLQQACLWAEEELT